MHRDPVYLWLLHELLRLWFHKHHWRICCYVTFNTIGYSLPAPGSLKNLGEGEDPIGKKFLLRRWPTICPWSVIDRSVPTMLSFLGNGEISLDYCHDFSPFKDGVAPLQQSKTVYISWSHEEWKKIQTLPWITLIYQEFIGWVSARLLISGFASYRTSSILLLSSLCPSPPGPRLGGLSSAARELTSTIHWLLPTCLR